MNYTNYLTGDYYVKRVFYAFIFYASIMDFFQVGVKCLYILGFLVHFVLKTQNLLKSRVYSEISLT